jgi:arginine exporter protein ArgO
MSETSTPRWIFLLQIASVAMIWVFVLSISIWILHLIRLSQALHDVPSASVAISIVAIPVFLTGASVLTYVFVGFQRGNGARGAEGSQEQEK